MPSSVEDNIRVSSDITESRLGEETVILHLTNGAYFGLDEVGTIIWEGLKQKQAPSEIAAQIAAAYDIGPSQAREDVDELITKLLENDLAIRST